MVHCKLTRTPTVSGLKLRASEGDPMEALHINRRTMGALQHVTIMRLEISFSENRVCWFMQSPPKEHWKIVQRICKCLQGTLLLCT